MIILYKYLSSSTCWAFVFTYVVNDNTISPPYFVIASVTFCVDSSLDLKIHFSVVGIYKNFRIIVKVNKCWRKNDNRIILYELSGGLSRKEKDWSSHFSHNSIVTNVHKQIHFASNFIISFDESTQ